MCTPLLENVSFPQGSQLRAGKWEESSPRTHVLVVNGDSLAAGVFVRAHVFVDAPVAAPATADAPLAPSNSKTTKQEKINKFANCPKPKTVGNFCRDAAVMQQWALAGAAGNSRPASRQLLNWAAVVKGEFRLCHRHVWEAQRKSHDDKLCNQGSEVTGQGCLRFSASLNLTFLFVFNSFYIVDTYWKKYIHGQWNFVAKTKVSNNLKYKTQLFHTFLFTI